MGTTITPREFAAAHAKECRRVANLIADNLDTLAANVRSLARRIDADTLDDNGATALAGELVNTYLQNTAANGPFLNNLIRESGRMDTQLAQQKS